MKLTVDTKFPLDAFVLTHDGAIKKVTIVRQQCGSSGFTSRGARYYHKDLYATKAKAIKKGEQNLKAHLKVNEARAKHFKKMVLNLNSAKAA